MAIAGEGSGWGKDWEFGTDMYTLLYLKQIINKDLVHNTGNSAQYFILTSMGKEFENMYNWIALLYT